MAQGAPLNRFWDFSKRYIARYFWWYFTGFSCVFLTQWLAVSLVDQFRQAINAASAVGATASTVKPYLLAIFGFAALLFVIRTASRLLVFTPGRLAEYHIRNDYYSHLLSLQRDFLSQHQSGDLVSRCSNDIGFIRAAYGFATLAVANVSATFILVIQKMIELDARVTLFAAIPMIIGLVIIQLSIRYLFTYWRVSNELLGDMSALCLAGYKGVAAIQNYHAEPALNERFSVLNDTYLKVQLTIMKNRTVVMPMVKLAADLSVFAVLMIAGVRVLNGGMQLGDILAFLSYIAMLAAPMMALGYMLNVFNRAIPAMERLDEILLAKPNLLPSREAEPDPNTQGAYLVASNLQFTFAKTLANPEPFSLKAVDLELKPGRVIGIAGALGSGKTVLLDTLLRLNNPEPNQLFLNGEDAAYMELDRYRACFSFVPQKPFLFSATLRENLVTALPLKERAEASEERLLQALTIAGFELNDKQFPHRLETQVGEKGVMLSGGQRQRMALARSLLKIADIYVLDDVLSAVDHETEKTIIANIREFAPGKSFMITSHRISAIQWADEILVMANGAIVDRGSHAALIERPGYYQDIYKYQSRKLGETKS